MFSPGFLPFAALIFLAVVSVHCRPQQELSSGAATTTEATTWDKIKKGVEDGWKVVYDESHCVAHKVKELVNHHDHAEGGDPCENKPYKQSTSTTEKTFVLVAEEKIPATSRP